MSLLTKWFQPPVLALLPVLFCASVFSQTQTIRPKVVVVSYFEVGADTGGYTAYLPSLEAAYAGGHRIVAEWMR